MLVDPDTGLVEALIESTWLTNLKTGAGTAVATALLARDDAETCAVLLWNRTRARAEALAARARAHPGGTGFVRGMGRRGGGGRGRYRHRLHRGAREADPCRRSSRLTFFPLG